MRLKTINSVTSFLETTSFSQSIVLDDDDDDEKTGGVTFGRWCCRLCVLILKKRTLALALRVLAAVVALAAAVLVIAPLL
jgi:hypothetical protein